MKEKIFNRLILSLTVSILAIGCGINSSESDDSPLAKQKVLNRDISKPLSNHGKKKKNYVENHLIVEIYADTPEQEIESLKKIKGVKKVKKVGKKHEEANTVTYQLIGDEKTDLIKMQTTIEKEPMVEHSEPDYLYELTLIPSDPQFKELWNHQKINTAEAWDKHFNSSDVTVAVIDSGLDITHPDLKNNLWRNPIEILGNGIDDDSNGFVDDIYGWNFINSNNDLSDKFAHGTQISGVIAAEGNNGVGIVGVGWKTKIMTLKVDIIDQYINLGQAISGIYYAVDNGAKILNLSWGGISDSDSLKNALSYAREKGVLVIASAGNNGSDLDVSPYYPCSYDLDNIVCAGGSDKNDELSYFSSYGAKTVDLMAPASDILSTIPGGNYNLSNGTSLATAHVSGTVALMKSFAPSLNYTDIKWHLLTSGDSIAAFSTVTTTGKRLNVKNAIFALDIVRLPPPEGLMVNSEGKNDLAVSWHPLLNDNVGGYFLYFGTDSELILADKFDLKLDTVKRITNLDTEITYYVSVAAYDEDGIEGKRTAIISANPQDKIPPGAILDLHASMGIQDSLAVDVFLSSGQYSDYFSAEKAVDRDTSTPWSTPARDEARSEYLVLDLHGMKEIAQVSVHPAPGLVSSFPAEIEIQVAGDDLIWKTVAYSLNHLVGENNPLILNLPLTIASHLRILLLQSTQHPNGKYYTSIGEVELFAPKKESDIQVEWTAPGDDVYVGSAQLYDIRYSANPLNNSNFAAAIKVDDIPDPEPSGTKQTIILANRGGEENIYIAIKSTDDKGNVSNISNIAHIRTYDIPPATINDLAVTAVTKTEIDLSFTSVGDDGLAGKAAAYDCRINTKEIGYHNWEESLKVNNIPFPKDSGTIQFINIDKLTANTQYYIAIRAIDEMGNMSGISNVVSVITLEANDKTPPAKINELMVQPTIKMGSKVLATAVDSSTGIDNLNRLTDSDVTTYWSSAAVTPEILQNTADMVVMSYVPNLSNVDINSSDYWIEYLDFETKQIQRISGNQNTTYQMNPQGSDISFSSLADVIGVQAVQNTSDVLSIFPTKQNPTESSIPANGKEVLVYTFDGTIGNDLSGNGNTGTNKGVTLVNAVFGKAGEFDGTDSIIVKDSSSISLTSGLTIETWVNLKVDHNSPAYTMFRKQGSYLFEIGDKGKNYLAFRAWLNTGFLSLDSKNPLQINKWYHVAVTFDGNTAKIFINGVLDNQVYKAGNIKDTSVDFNIGNWSSEKFIGLLDETRISNYAKDPTQFGKSKTIHRLFCSQTIGDSIKNGNPVYSEDNSFQFSDIKHKDILNFYTDKNTLPSAGCAFDDSSFGENKATFTKPYNYLAYYLVRTDAQNYYKVRAYMINPIKKEAAIQFEQLDPNGNEVKYSKITHHVTLDLGTEKTIGKIRATPYFRKLSQFPTHFRFETSTDNIDYLPVAAEYYYHPKLDQKNYVQSWEKLINPTPARYIKMIGEQWEPDDATDISVTMSVAELEAFESGYDLTSARLIWVAPGDDDYRGLAKEYDIRIAPLFIVENSSEVTGENVLFGNASVVANNIIPTLPGGFEVFEINDLKPETDYCVAIKTKDDAQNVSLMSNVSCFITPSLLPNPVFDLAVTDKSGNTVQLSWTASGDDGVTGTASAYVIKFSKKLITELSWGSLPEVSQALKPKAPGEKENFWVGGMESETLYYFAIKVVDEHGNFSPLSNIAEGISPDTVAPSEVSDLYAKAPPPEATLPLVGSVQEVSSELSTSGLGILASDHDVSTAWITSGKSSNEPEFMIMELDLPAELERVRVIPHKDFRDIFPSDFSVSVSEDGLVWQNIGSVQDVYGRLVNDVEFVFNPVFAQFIRVDISRMNVSVGKYLSAIAEVFAYELQDRTDELIVTWSAVGDNGLLGRAASYDIRYSEGNITEANWNNAQKIPDAALPTPNQSGLAHLIQIFGLKAETDYYFAMKVSDEVPNTSKLSNVAKAMTLGVPPSRIQDLSAENPNYTTIDLKWSAPSDDSGKASSYEIRFSPQPISLSNFQNAFMAPFAPAPADPNTLQTYTVQGLNVDSWYYFAMLSFDSKGNKSRLSNIVSLKTLSLPESIPPSKINDLVAQPSTDIFGQIILTWSAPGDDDKLGIAQTYQLIYSTNPLSSNSFENNNNIITLPIQPKPYGVNEEWAVEGLLDETLYYFAVRAVDDSGNFGLASNIAAAATLPIPPAAIDDLMVTGHTPSALTISWISSGDNGEIGTASAYVIKISQNAITEANFDQASSYTNPPLPMVSGSVQSVTFTNLSQDTTYYFAIKSFDDLGQVSSISNIASGKTDDIVAPSSVANLTAKTGVDIGTIKLSWNASGDNGGFGDAASYDIRYSLNEITKDNFDQATKAVFIDQPKSPGYPETFTVKNLLHEMGYYFALKVNDEAGNTSALSNVVFAKTLDVPPGRVYDLIVLNPTANTVDLMWTAPGSNHYEGQATRYEIRVSLAPITEKNYLEAPEVVNVPVPKISGSQEIFTVQQLLADTGYYFAMRTCDEKNLCSVVSNVVYMETLDVIAPSKVIDLKANDGSAEGTVTLMWTSSGDDVLSGTPKFLEIRYHSALIDENNWSSATPISNQTSPSGGGSYQTHIVSGLEHESPFFFALQICDDSNNCSPISNSVSARTPEVPPASVANVKLTANSINMQTLDCTLSFEFFAVGDDGNVGKAVSYELFYNYGNAIDKDENVPILATKLEGLLGVPKESGQTEKFTVTKLSPNTKYWFYIRAIDDHGNIAAFSKAWGVETKDPFPPASVTTLTAKAPDLEGKKLSVGIASVTSQFSETWSVHNIVDGNVVTHWASSAKKSEAEGDSIKFIVSGENPKIEKISLYPVKDYENLFPKEFDIQVSTDNALWSSVIEVRNFQVQSQKWASWTFVPTLAKYIRINIQKSRPIEESFYTMISEMEVYGPAPRKDLVILQWLAPGDDDNTGNANKYDIRYSLNPISIANFASATSVGSKTPSTVGSFEYLEVSGLLGETTYYFALKAADEAGNWSPGISNVASATTVGIPPSQITDLKSISVGVHEVTLQWTAPGDDNNVGQAQKYEIRMSDQLFNAATFADMDQVNNAKYKAIIPLPVNAGTKQTIQIGDDDDPNLHVLSDEYTYFVGIVAYDDNGNRSLLSNVATFTTTYGPDGIPPAKIETLTVQAPSATFTTISPLSNTASSEQFPDFISSNVLDKDNLSDWVSQPLSENSLVVLSMTISKETVTPQLVQAVRLRSSTNYPDLFPVDFRIDVKMPGCKNNFTTVAQYSNVPIPSGWIEFQFPSPMPAIVLQIVITKTRQFSNGFYYTGLSEVEIVGTQGAPGEVVLSWISVGDDDFFKTATKYDLRYSYSPIDASNFSTQALPLIFNNAVVPSKPYTIESVRVTGLLRNKTVYFAIKTKDEQNWSEISNVVSIEIP